MIEEHLIPHSSQAINVT